MLNKVIKEGLNKKEELERELDNEDLKKKVFNTVMYTNLSDIMEKTDLNKDHLSDLITGSRNVIETEEDIIVRIDLPGIRKENIKLSVTESKMNLKASFDKEDIFGSNFYTDSEKEECKINKTIRFPVEVLPKKTTASFENGVLIVKCPREDVKESITIDIE